MDSEERNIYGWWHMWEKGKPRDKAEQLDLLKRFDFISYNAAFQGPTPAEIRAVNPRAKVYLYCSPLDKSEYDADVNGGILDQDEYAVSYADAVPLLTQTGEPVRWKQTLKQDPRKIDPVKTVIRLRDLCQLNGYDGIVWDMLWPRIAGYCNLADGELPQGYMTEAEYWDAYWQHLCAVVTGLRAIGLKVIANCPGTWAPGTTFYGEELSWKVAAQRSLFDGAIYELTCANSAGVLHSQREYKANLTALANDPLPEVWCNQVIDPAWPNAEQLAELTLATFYLANQNRPGFTVGRTFGMYAGWDARWDMELGSPTQPMQQYGKYVWAREYTQGLAVVNYSDNVLEFHPAQQAMVYSDVNENYYQGTVLMAPRTGKVLKERRFTSIPI